MPKVLIVNNIIPGNTFVIIAFFEKEIAPLLVINQSPDIPTDSRAPIKGLF